MYYLKGSGNNLGGYVMPAIILVIAASLLVAGFADGVQDAADKTISAVALVGLLGTLVVMVGLAMWRLIKHHH